MKKINEIIIEKHASKLGPKRVDVLKMRYGIRPYRKTYSLREIGIKHSTSIERVYEVEQKAIQMITNAIIGD